MPFALVLFHDALPGAIPAVTEAQIGTIREVLARTPNLREGLIFTPASAQDNYVDDGASPPLGLQLIFDRLEDLEAAAGRDGALQSLPEIAGTRATAQAFWRRTWPVAEPARGACSYVVHYIGPAQDPNAWHDHYIAGHPVLFQKLPGIRGIEILTPVEWISHLPHQKVHHLQRNRVTFDSPEALTAAMQSPVRDELREDFHTFPPFEGSNYHYPMWVETVTP